MINDIVLDIVSVKYEPVNFNCGAVTFNCDAVTFYCEEVPFYFDPHKKDEITFKRNGVTLKVTSHF